MKGKRLLAGIVTAVMCLTLNGFKSVHADTKTEKTSYTIEDLRNLQDFLLARETPDLRGKDYDLNDDGRWDVFDLCLMKQQYAKVTEYGENACSILFISSAGRYRCISQCKPCYS